MLDFQLRPGMPQASRQIIIRHWPFLAAVLTAFAVAAAILCPISSPPGRPVNAAAAIASAADQLSLAAVPPSAAEGHGYLLKGPGAVPAPKAPDRYRVRSRDTLSQIAARFYGHADRWPALWWVNRAKIRNPDALPAGVTLRLSSWHPDKAWVSRAALAAIPPPPAPRLAVRSVSAPASQGSIPAQGVPTQSVPAHAGVYSYSALEALWVAAGGPSWAAPKAAEIGICESGGNPGAYNPSGASGLMQILGLPFPGDPFDPATNMRMAVAKFTAAGDSFTPWVCQ